MIRRAGVQDIPAIKALINDPAIRPTVGGEGELNPSAIVADRRNICLFSDDGGAFFAWRGPGVFEGHSFFRVRGRAAIDLGRAMLGMIEARMIWGLTPEGNRPARWFNRQLGFQSLGMIDTPEGRCELFVMEGLCPLAR